METEKIQINLPENTPRVEVILREGQAVKELEPKAPIKTYLKGVIGVPYEYILKRIGKTQFSEDRSHIIVNREKISISLIIHENDEYLRGEINGYLELYPKFVEFGINSNKLWTPADLGMFIKMNRSFFPNRDENMKLVSELMNFNATVSNKIDRSIKENGDRTDNFAQMVNSNLPSSFKIEIPIFKGQKPEILEVETFAQINGREVSFVLLSPSANQTLESIRNQVIDQQLEQIRLIAPDIAIIEE